MQPVRPSTEPTQESDGNGLGPNFNNTNEVAIWLYSDDKDLTSPVGVTPSQDIDVHFSVQTGPVVPNATLGVDFDLVDKATGLSVAFQTGPFGYWKHIPASTPINHSDANLQIVLLDDMVPLEDIEALEIRIEDVKPSSLGYLPGAYNQSYRWLIMDN